MKIQMLCWLTDFHSHQSIYSAHEWALAIPQDIKLIYNESHVLTLQDEERQIFE
jgi:hypothetical protein